MIKKEKLKIKGWEDDEIRKVEQVLSSDKDKKHMQYRKRMHNSLFWLSLIVLIAANFVVLVGIMPYLLRVNNNDLIYMVLGSFGFVFGSLFASMIMELDQLKAKHHIFAVLLFPLIILVNIVLLVSVSAQNNSIQLFPGIIMMVSVYMLLFLIPYAMYYIMGIKDKKIL